jgi:hypothetical protein
MLPIFRPAGRKIGNNKIESTLLPQAQNHLEVSAA